MTRFSRIGFIFAAAGAAVGLGNIWKFPYITGEYGGGAFVLVYLLTIFFIGFSILVVEMYIGSRGASDGVNSFEHLAPKGQKSWKYAGFMVFNGLIIMTFYSVVIGWILYYMYMTITVGLPTDLPTATADFEHLLNAQPFSQLLWHTVATFIVLFVLYKGIKKGIEKMNLILMPALVVILVGLLIYAMTFGEAFARSFSFMFYPHFEKLTSEGIVKAIGHAFFTLSIGMGAILTYAASLPKKTSITKAAFIVTFLDTAIALIAGLMIFAFLFHFGGEPAKGPGLVFISLPVIFAKIGMTGTVVALLFFLALAFAGLTSAVSLVEPSVSFFQHHFKQSRKKAVLTAGSIYYMIGILVLLSTTQGVTEYLSVGKKTLFDILEFMSDAILLPVAGLLMAIFAGYVLPKSQIKTEMRNEMSRGLFAVWYFSVRFIAPIALIFMLLNLTGIITIGSE